MLYVCVFAGVNPMRINGRYRIASKFVDISANAPTSHSVRHSFATKSHNQRGGKIYRSIVKSVNQKYCMPIDQLPAPNTHNLCRAFVSFMVGAGGFNP